MLKMQQTAPRPFPAVPVPSLPGAPSVFQRVCPGSATVVLPGHYRSTTVGTRLMHPSNASGPGFVAEQSGNRELDGPTAEHGWTGLCGLKRGGEEAWNAPQSRLVPATGS